MLQDRDSETENLAKKVLGKPFPPELDSIDQYLSRMRDVGPFKPSMVVDFEMGRPIEIEAILGNAVRIADKINCPVPLLRALYAILKIKMK